MLRKSLFLVVALFCIPLVSNAQADDNIVWATLKVNKQINAKTSVSLAPIFRINNDISSYQNISVDVAMRRSFGKGWSGQLLARTWFIPDQKERQFIWLDLTYQKQFQLIKISSFLRYHQALDINERDDPDYLRWKTSLFYPLGKFSPWVAIEPWLRLNQFGELQRIRYEAGMNCKFDQRMQLMLGYRREESLNLENDFCLNVYLLTLTYSLPAKSSG